MSKIGAVLGVATLAVMAGCLDPNYKGNTKSMFRPKAAQPAVEPAVVEPTVEPVSGPEAEPRPVPVAVDDPAMIEVTVEPAAPVEPAVEPVPAQPVPPPPPSAQPVPPPPPATTVYIVQRGDTLSKISKRFNIKMDAIKAANPQLKGDMVRLGQKLTLPGQVEVGEQTVPEGAFAKPAPKPPAGPYTGPTTEYTVQSGDMLGTIALKHKCTVRQLKELNGLKNDTIVVGRKLVVPAAGAVPPPPPPAAQPAPAPKPAPVAKAEKPAPKPAKPVVESPAVAKPVEQPKAAPEPEQPAAVVEPPVETPASAPAAAKYDLYEVQEGDDLTNVTINFGVTASEVRELNNLSDDAQLSPGMMLKLPAGSTKLP